jgi:hypothetical protein
MLHDADWKFANFLAQGPYSKSDQSACPRKPDTNSLDAKQSIENVS